ncbi:hypothetical protein HS088_TW08G00378 [Tripterygium wilfordii]|uniref:Uncharacterized protein n=2 Tax=Tripterygium wilfordii TaxID=458696 RepID=A0A7J7DBR3_TRIWF|nr:hypothetical protein HS088_TW08G00378 [Tripterygium wilfordii]
MVASPLHTAASVPFRWEEVPGKPRPCSTLINIPTQKCLELPPRLLMDAETAKLSSPSTVLEGPYMGRSRFQSTSFSLKRESFRKIWSPQVGKFDPLVLSNGDGKTGKVGFGSWRWGKSPFKGKCEVVVGNHVFPSSVDGESDINTEDDDESCKKRNVKTTTEMKRSGSYTISPPARPHFWATVYEGLKKVVPWKTRKLKKDGMLY